MPRPNRSSSFSSSNSNPSSPPSSRRQDASHLLNFRTSTNTTSHQTSSSQGKWSRNHRNKKHTETPKQRQKREEAERRERQARKALSSMFYLHASAYHGFVLARKSCSRQLRLGLGTGDEGATPGAPAAAAASSTLSTSPVLDKHSEHVPGKKHQHHNQPHRPLAYNYAGPDVAVNWDAVRLVKCLIPTFTPGLSGCDGGTTMNAATTPNINHEVSSATCPICLDTYTSPRITKCGHVFCLPCILHHVHTSSTTRVSKCPCCSVHVSTVELRPVIFISIQTPRAHATMSFVKLHRSKGCYAPYIPQFGRYKRFTKHAAPTMIQDEDSPYCRFNYLNVDWYEEHLLSDRASLGLFIRELNRTRYGTSVEMGYAQMAVQYVEEEIRRAKQEREEELDLQCQYEQRTQNRMCEVIHCVGKSGKKVDVVEGKLGQKLLANEGESLVMARDDRERDPNVISAVSSSYDDDDDDEKNNFHESEAGVMSEDPSASPGVAALFDSSSALAIERGMQTLPVEVGREDTVGSADVPFAMDDIPVGGSVGVVGAVAAEEKDIDYSASADGAVVDDEANVGKKMKKQQQHGGRNPRWKGDKASGKEHSSSKSMRRHLPDLPASMYLDDECTHFYQASDGQLCFLSGFNMNCLMAEFSSSEPPQLSTEERLDHSDTIDKQVGEEEEREGKGGKQQERREQRRQMERMRRKMQPLPDVISGQVIDVEDVHLTPEMRRRMPFLSHLPLYTDVKFVELDLSRILSNETKAQFKAELERRRKKRRNRAIAERKADKLAKEREEGLINERKARIQMIDPNDEFFQAVAPSSSFDGLGGAVPSGDDFGPGLLSRSGTGSSSRTTGRQTQSIPSPQAANNSIYSFRSVCATGGIWPGLADSMSSATISTSPPGNRARTRGATPTSPTSGAWGSRSPGALRTVPGNGSGVSATSSPALKSVTALGDGINPGVASSPSSLLTPLSSSPPVSSVKRKGGKGKGKKIVLFSTGGHRGSAY